MKRFGPAFEVRDFRLWWLALLGMGISLQMIEVVIGWQVYGLHRSALDLGWIGLALISAAGVTEVWAYLAMAMGAGTAMALGWPAARAMPPTLVSVEALPNAMVLRSIASQTGMVIGPAIGGLLYGVSAVVVYLVAAASCVLASVSVAAMRPAPAADVPRPAGEAGQPATVSGLLEGLRFVRRTQVLLGAILLDLLAVLFGGAVALLPIFARSILHVGATGLGVLRAAPAVGALLAAAYVTRRPIAGRAGRTLLIAVGLYGASIVVFGLSRTFVLSLLALGVGGFVDLYSMNIRSTIVALASPDRLRGRVNAVEMVFISASNQLGAFESGLAAYLVGTVPAVVGGGVMTMLIAVSWSRMFPALAEVDRLEDVQAPEPGPAELELVA